MAETSAATSNEAVDDNNTQENQVDTNSVQNDNDPDMESAMNSNSNASAENTTIPTVETISIPNNDPTNDTNATPATNRDVPNANSYPTRSLMSSIVIRRTEETLQMLQSDLQHASEDLIRTLGEYLSQHDNNNSRSLGGISLPAAAVSWLTSHQSTLQLPTTRLSHLRITADTWPPKHSSNSIRLSSDFQNSEQDLHQQYLSLQIFHRLRFHPQMDITVFPSLRVLLLDQVPPDWILNLHKLQNTLQVLRCERTSLNDLKEFLLGRDDDDTNSSESSVCYTKLSHFKMVHCNLGDATRGLTTSNTDNNDSSTRQRSEAEIPLAHMPALCYLSLAHNRLSSEDTLRNSGISEAPRLTKLDLSYNNIPSMVQAPLYLGNLKTLFLTGNKLQSAEGIDRLYALQTLALDKNNIRSWLQVKGLARLPELKVLHLRGNPFMETSAAERRYVRVMLLDLFRDQRWASSVGNSNNATFRQLEFILPVLDGKPVSDRELRALQQRAFVTVRGDRLITPSNVNGSNPPVETTPLSEGWTLLSTGKGVQNRRKRKGIVAIIEDKPASARRPGGIVRSHATRPQAGTGESTTNSFALTPKNGERLKGPDVSFNINDIILSLGPKKSKATTANADDAAEVDNGGAEDAKPLQNDTATQAPDASKVCNVVDREASEQFIWPEPLPYLPKENLYAEFEWSPPAAISLSEEKEIPKAVQKKKKTKAESKKKDPPSINTEEGDDTSIKFSKKRSPNGAVSPKAGKMLAGSVSPPKHKSVGAASISSAASGAHQWTAAGDASPFADTNVHADEVSTSASLSSQARKQNADGRISLASLNIRSVSSDDGDDSGLLSPSSAAFPAMAMDVTGGDDLTCSSMGTNMSNAESRMSGLRGPNRQDKFSLAESKSKWMGVEQERGLVVASNLELYFQNFVFPDFVPSFDAGQLDEDTNTWQFVFFNYPRIQLLPKDRDLRESCAAKRKLLEVQSARVGEDRERLVKVWKEHVVACGKPALRRLPPNRTAHFGFHGELSWQDGKVKTVSECRQVILCLSNTSLYVILDNDSLTEKEQKPSPRKGGMKEGTIKSGIETSPTPSRRKTRKFASPLPVDATFEQALWPHAVACHPLADVMGITIGFGFQRMTLRIRNSAYPSAVDYTYQLLTSNKMKTVTLLRDLQGLVKEVKMVMGQTTLTDDPIKIDNDDRQFLDGLAATVAPAPLGAVLHYQILKQRWKHGQRGAVSRICVVTDAKIFLLDEDYIGDGSQSVNAEVGRRLGSPAFRLIDSADLNQISEVKAADADPNAITIIIRPSQTLLRTHRWRLLCRDRSGAEKLVEDVRKGMAMAE